MSRQEMSWIARNRRDADAGPRRRRGVTCRVRSSGRHPVASSQLWRNCPHDTGTSTGRIRTRRYVSAYLGAMVAHESCATSSRATSTTRRDVVHLAARPRVRPVNRYGPHDVTHVTEIAPRRRGLRPRSHRAPRRAAWSRRFAIAGTTKCGGLARTHVVERPRNDHARAPFAHAVAGEDVRPRPCSSA